MLGRGSIGIGKERLAGLNESMQQRADARAAVACGPMSPPAMVALTWSVIFVVVASEMKGAIQMSSLARAKSNHSYFGMWKLELTLFLKG